jgi:hypothetical protein
MKRTRVAGLLAALSLLSGLLGCDVAVVAALASKKKGGSSSNAAPAPDTTFRLWVSELGAIAGAAEQATLLGNHGDPDAKWVPVTPVPATGSGEYTMPPPTAGGFNAILIQATDLQVYEIDAFEIIDSTGTTTAVPATVFAGNVTGALSLAQGYPDGQGLVTAATATDRAFVFMKHSAPITKFRVSLWGQGRSRTSGDVQWTQGFDQANDLAGGAAISSQGVTHVVFREAGNIWLLRIDQDGAIVKDISNNELISLANGLTVSSTIGSQSVVIDRNHSDVVYFGLTRGAGDIQIQKYDKDITNALWLPPLSIATSGIDRIERNGLAVTPNGSLLVAGAIDYGGLNGVGHYFHRFLPDRSDPWIAATPPSVPVDGNDNYWYAVAATTDQDFFLAGNITEVLPVGDIDALTSRIEDLVPGGGITEKWNNHNQGATSHTATARSIGVDGNTNVYIAGAYANADLDSFIVQCNGISGLATPHITSSRIGNDELLDIAVESDGTIYATGYETNGAQGEDLVLYKIAPNKAVLWKRTVDKAGLADRGVKVMTTATHVLVVGQIGVAAGNLDIHVRKYVK